MQNLELFEFKCVLALPKTSRIRLAFIIVCKLDSPDKNSMMCLVVSVFPDPETPVVRIDWLIFVNFILVRASFAEIIDVSDITLIHTQIKLNANSKLNNNILDLEN